MGTQEPNPANDPAGGESSPPAAEEAEVTAPGAELAKDRPQQAKPSGLRARVDAVAARVRALDVLPSRAVTVPLRKALPNDTLGWVSAILLWGVFFLYVSRWVTGNKELLFDPLYANDDSRTAHFPFHRWGPEGALTDDPIAEEMRHYWMPAMSLLYRIFVPLVGMFWAPKVAQGLALGMLLYAGWLLVRAKRAGLACGTLLVFLLLHDNFAVNRLAGGFGRAFTFPCFALWLAGAISASERARYVATIIGAVTQNYTVAILLGAEGIFSVLDAFGKSRALLVRRVKRYAALLAACVVLVGGYVATQSNMGHIHSLEEVERTVLFKNRHRQEFPLADPAPQFGKWLMSPFSAAGKPMPGMAELKHKFEKQETSWPLAIVALLFMLGAARVSPPARPALAFLSATLLLYLLSRLFAYKLYAPERYYSYGAPMVSVILAVCALGLLAPRLRRRAVVRNFAAAGFILGLWAFSGDGIIERNGMTIHQRPQAKLFEFVKTLPVNARIACHPWDGDDIPWWAARATTGGFETAQMWQVETAARTETRTKDVLRALYATSRQEVLDYAKRYQVTHFMLRKDRYGQDVAKKAAFIEPFTSFSNQMLASVQQEALVLGQVPDSAVIYRQGNLLIVDVALLEKAWRSTAL
jgi:hypothetical protein